MTISTPPPAPSTSDPANFDAEGDALLAWFATFVPELNAAITALNLNSTTDTSASSVAIGTGAKTFAVTAGKSFQPGMYLVIADTAAPSTNSMFGQITSYSGTSLVMDIRTIRGSGTKTAWVISQSSAGGAAAGANSDITSLSALSTFNGVPVRQGVLSGATAFLAIGTGLSVNLLATTTPLRVAFAAGMGDSGAIDHVGTHSADVAGYFSGLTANVVNYFFDNRDATTGALTGVASTLAYIMQDASVAISVVNGQHTWVYDTGRMYVGNGTVATAVQRTAIGECLAGASTITSVTSYAKLGEYDSGLFAVVATTLYSKNANIGAACDVFLYFSTSSTGLDGGTNEEVTYGNTGSAANPNYRGVLFGQSTKNVIRARTSDLFQVMDASGNSTNPASGYLRLTAKRRHS